MIMETAERKLTEGWHNTESYGEVYVSPGGIAWVVQQIGDELASVSVPLAKEDIIREDSATRRIKTEQKKKQPSYIARYGKQRRP